MRTEQEIFEGFAYDLLFDEIKPSDNDVASLARTLRQTFADWLEQKDSERLANRDAKWQALLDERRGK